MNSTYKLMTDSCCDLPEQLTASFGVKVFDLNVGAYMRRGGVKDIRLKSEKTDVPRFYKELRRGALILTSAVSEEAFYAKMRDCLTSGRDVLYIGFSSVLSATYRNACAAAEKLRPEFPERKVICIDSKSASMGQGLLVYYAMKLRAEGRPIDEVAERTKALIPRVCHWFTVDSTYLLKHGGRINATVGAPPRLFAHMKPVMHVDDEGHLVNVGRIRGRKAAIKALFEIMKKSGTDIEHNTVMISHGDCYEDALSLADMIKAELHPGEIIINTVSPVIGAHSGPGTLALFFIGSGR